MRLKRFVPLIILAASLMSGCYKPGPGAKTWQVSGVDGGGSGGAAVFVTPEVDQPFEAVDIEEVLSSVKTPTPNSPIVLPTPREEPTTYVVQQGDILRNIALQFQVSVIDITIANELENPNLIEVGQVLIIPPPSFEDRAPTFKILPDSELVNSPSNADFDVAEFVKAYGGYLSLYSEGVDGINLSGVEIIQRVALEYSVNPKLLLTVLEYQSGWVTEREPIERTLVYPLGYFDAGRVGLYKQLAWGANLLNEGYYLWKINAISVWLLSDNQVVQVDPTINPGTAGVLNLMRHLLDRSAWEHAVSEEGLFSIYYQFFGYPFEAALEPLIPDDLMQPVLQLPFEQNAVWSFTGGPHGGWDSGSAWAAIDFAPPGDALGCFPSAAWVVASASGEIVFSDHGAVIQDLDDDGIWQTGWSILYMHIDPWERVDVGTILEAGDRIGHPSCEGGFSTGTHLHIARRYNGEWIAAEGDLPLVLDGWITEGYGVEYNGYLVKDDKVVEAWNGRSPLNAIKR